MNTRISYMYRDAHNFKQHESVVVEGEVSEQDLLSCLDRGEFFIPGQVGLADLQQRFSEDGKTVPGEPNHVWHQLEGVTLTEEEPACEITAGELLKRFRTASRDGWDCLEAWQRLGG